MNYQDLTPLPPNTRTQADLNCKCKVCQISRLGLEYAQHASEHSNPANRPRLSPISPPARVLPLCSKCFCEIGSRKPHLCDKKTKSDNLSKLVKNTSEKTRSKVTCHSLKTVAEDQGVGARGGTVQLGSGSKLLPVVVGTTKQKPKLAKFSHENLLSLQLATNLSDKSIK